MRNPLRVALTAGAALAASYVGFLWFTFGGLERYQPPFEIVVPESVKGVVCATSRRGATEDIDHVVRHEVNHEGLLLVDGDVLRSHRPRRLLIRMSDGQLLEVPSASLLAIFTENDTSTGEWYTVMWRGTTDEWKAFQETHEGKSFCLGRFTLPQQG